MGTIDDMINKLNRFQDELKNINNQIIPVTPDKNGMIDRQCPNSNCNFYFKVDVQDYKEKFNDYKIYCPNCRKNAPSSDFLPTAHRQEIILNLRKSISKYWENEIPISRSLQAIKATDEFELKIKCDKCDSKFAVIGAAYFCPNCGYNSVEKTAQDSVEKIILKAEKIDKIKSALENTFSKDDATIMTQSILKSSLTEIIGTLQIYSEEKYKHLSGETPPFNAFQNIEKTNKLWYQLKNENYNNWLTEKEQIKLFIYTQRRHLLEHKGSIVDEKYLNKTNDNDYEVGDRIIVSAKDISVLGKIVLKIIKQINKY